MLQKAHCNELYAHFAGCYGPYCDIDPAGPFASPAATYSYEHCKLAGLPDLNHTNPSVLRRMQDVFQHTLTIYAPDGLRFDAAGHSDLVSILVTCSTTHTHTSVGPTLLASQYRATPTCCWLYSTSAVNVVHTYMVQQCGTPFCCIGRAVKRSAGRATSRLEALFCTIFFGTGPLHVPTSPPCRQYSPVLHESAAMICPAGVLCQPHPQCGRHVRCWRAVFSGQCIALHAYGGRLCGCWWWT